jgi:hypothetical protein
MSNVTSLTWSPRGEPPPATEPAPARVPIDPRILAASQAAERAVRTMSTATRPVEQYEYDVVTSGEPLPRSRLNELGRTGWLLTSVEGPRVTSDHTWIYYFRRRTIPTDGRNR